MGEQKAEEKEEPSEILDTPSERSTRGSQIKSPYFFLVGVFFVCLNVESSKYNTEKVVEKAYRNPICEERKFLFFSRDSLAMTSSVDEILFDFTFPLLAFAQQSSDRLECSK